MSTARVPYSYFSALLLPAVALFALSLIAPLISLSGPALAASALFAFVCVSAEVLVAAALTPRSDPKWLVFVILPLAALAMTLLLGDALDRRLAAALVTIALLSFGTLVGAAVGNAIEHAGYLIIVALISAMVDAFSVFHRFGPTGQIIEIEAAVSVLLLPWPILGTDDITPILGLGDIVFVALYLAAARRHALSITKTVFALSAGLSATLAVLLVWQTAIPALPFLGIGVVLVHREAWNVPREERLRAALGIAGLAVVLGLLFLLM